MTGPTYQFPEVQTPGQANADRIYTAAMTGLYGWTAAGMLLAGAAGWTLHLMDIYLVASLGAIILTIGLLMGTHFTAKKGVPIVERIAKLHLP